jgi:hypothetical protein
LPLSTDYLNILSESSFMNNRTRAEARKESFHSQPVSKHTLKTKILCYEKAAFAFNIIHFNTL